MDSSYNIILFHDKAVPRGHPKAKGRVTGGRSPTDPPGVDVRADEREVANVSGQHSIERWCVAEIVV
jgi:hypothetical protein